MKKVNYILTILCGAALLASSCSKLNTVPVFDAAESFASISVETASVAENKGQIVIPVQVASIDPVKTSISYKLIDGTAKAGVDYEDTNASAVLTFDGEQRTADIVIKIIDRPGDYTGDLDFSVELVAATGLKLSMEKTCKVTINDLDHPLAAILGSYTVSCYDYFQKAVTYTITLSKDPKDISVAWADFLLPVMRNGKFYPVYCVVAKDEGGNYTLSFPGGQGLGDVGYGDEYLYKITEFDGESISWSDVDPIVFTQTKTGFETSMGMMIYDGSFWQGGVVLGEESAALGSYKTVWTKITE